MNCFFIPLRHITHHVVRHAVRYAVATGVVVCVGGPVAGWQMMPPTVEHSRPVNEDMWLIPGHGWAASRPRNEASRLHEFVQVPEPWSLALMLPPVGLLGLLRRAR